MHLHGTAPMKGSLGSARPLVGLPQAVRGGNYRRQRGLCQAQDGKSTDDHAWVQRPTAVGYARQVISLEPHESAPQPGSGSLPAMAPATPSHLPTAGAPPQPAPLVAGELSWQQWLSYFEQADAASEWKEQLMLELKDAIHQQQYSVAAQLKAELSSLEAQDPVAVVRRHLDQAIAQQRYSDAAALRDAGLSNLAGWWAGQAEDDPVGHLLHITAEYSRWTGRMFRPRDIAELKMQKPGLFGRPTPRPSFSTASKPSGSPMLEVYVRKEGSSSPVSNTSSAANAKGGRSAGYLHQAVSLRLPTAEEVEQRRMRSNMQAAPVTPPPSPTVIVRTEEPQNSLQQGWPSNVPPPPSVARASSTSSSSPTVRLSVSIRRDGSARIAGMLPAQPVLSYLSAWEATEAEETMRMLRWASSPSSPEPYPAAPPAATGGPTVTSSSILHAQHPQRDIVASQPDVTPHLSELSTPDDIVDLASQHAMSSMDADSDTTAATMPGAGLGHSGPAYGGPGRGNLYASDEGLEEFYTELMRVPARLEVLGRGQMVFHMPQNPAANSTMQGRIGAASSDGWAPLAGVLTSNRGGRLYGNDSSTSTSSSAASSSASSLVAEGAAVSSEEGTSSFEVIVPMASSATSKPLAEGDPSCVMSAPADAVSAEALNILADQVAQSMEAKVGRSAPREEIAEALREVVRRVAAGEPSSAVDVLYSAGDSGAAALMHSPHAAVQQVAEVKPLKTTNIFYKRLTIDQPPHTDPLSGLYLGSFGPHGPELLNLSRAIVDGEETVLATKVTGDANVPAGLVSFRAKIGRKQKLDARDVYPDELGIAARFKGEGRVAQKGFAQPRWVEGELLVFNSKGNPLTAGAELGFVWAVPGEKRFLILLNRVNLGDVGK